MDLIKKITKSDIHRPLISQSQGYVTGQYLYDMGMCLCNNCGKLHSLGYTFCNDCFQHITIMLVPGDKSKDSKLIEVLRSLKG